MPLDDDDRYGWLDAEAAERLLDGEPLDLTGASSPRERAAAERLVAFLAVAASSVRPAPDTELPGERAALAAFRAARAGGAGGASARPAPAEEPRVAGTARPAAQVNGTAAPGHGTRANDTAAPGRVTHGDGAAASGVARQAGDGSGPLVRLVRAPGRPTERRTGRRLRVVQVAAGVAAMGCVLGAVALANRAGLGPDPVAPATSASPDDTHPTATGAPRTDDPDAERSSKSPAAGGGVGARPDHPGQDDRRSDADRQHDNDVMEEYAPLSDAELDRLCRWFAAGQRGKADVPDTADRAAGGAEAVEAYCAHRENPTDDNGRSESHGPDDQDDKHAQKDKQKEQKEQKKEKKQKKQDKHD